MTARAKPPVTPGLPGLHELLALLVRDAPDVEVRKQLDALDASGAIDPPVFESLVRDVLELHDARVADRRRAEALTALADTAADLASQRRTGDVLTAICRRSRQLLGTDVAYVTLRDDERGDTYVQATDGVVSPEFRTMRLPTGVGLGGLVAQTSRPEATADYQHDERFTHSEDLDHRVAAEGLRAIVAVPLLRETEVLGVLLSGSRRPRTFEPAEVSHFATLGTHAAIALENARLIEESREALDRLGAVHAELEIRAEQVRRAAATYDELAALALQGSQIPDLLDALVLRLPGEVELRSPEAEILVARRASGLGRLRTGWIEAPLPTGQEPLGSLRLRVLDAEGFEADVLDRLAVVIAGMLLARRADTEGAHRRRSMLLEELLTAPNADTGQLSLRAGRAGIAMHRTYLALVIAVTDPSDRWAWLNAIRHAGQRDAVVGTVSGRIVVVEPEGDLADAARSWTAALRTAHDQPPTIGLVGGAIGVEGLRSAYLEAVRAVTLLIALGRQGSWASPAELGIFGRMLGVGRDDDLSGFIERTLGPVIDHDLQRGTALLDTLDAFLAHGGHLADTHRALGIHVNTLYQRLDRLTELLSSDWREPDRRLELHLAIRLRDLAATLG